MRRTTLTTGGWTWCTVGRIHRPRSASRKNPFRSSPSLALALEVDYLPGREAGFANSPRVSRGIISSALCRAFPESWDIDNPAKLSEWKRRDAFEVWSACFDSSRWRRVKLLISSAMRICEKIRHPACAVHRRFYSLFLEAAKKVGTAVRQHRRLQKSCRRFIPAVNPLNWRFKEYSDHVRLRRSATPTWG